MARRRASVLVVLAVTAVLVVGSIAAAALHQRQQDVLAVCAIEFEDAKTELEGYRWSWLPPGWVCEFRSPGAPTQGYERRLPLLAG